MAVSSLLFELSGKHKAGIYWELTDDYMMPAEPQVP
jgi:hypothetical protein